MVNIERGLLYREEIREISYALVLKCGCNGLEYCSKESVQNRIIPKFKRNLLFDDLLLAILQLNDFGVMLAAVLLFCLLFLILAHTDRAGFILRCQMSKEVRFLDNFYLTKMCLHGHTEGGHQIQVG